MNSFSTSTGLLKLKTTDYNTYDMYPFYNITAKITVTASRSVQTANIVEDEFLISVAEKCRKFTFSTGMVFTSAGPGETAANPLTGDQFNYLHIPMTRT